MRGLIVAVWLASACTETLAPDVGPPAHAACSGIDSDPSTAVTFSQIEEIIDEYKCRHCHTPGGDTPIGLVVGGLDLTDYEGLRHGGVRSGASVVVPGKPCESVLLQKVGAGPPFGTRMPLDGPPYLDEEDLVLISDWIAEGASDR